MNTQAAPSLASWWRTAAVYQVYIRSFADRNGDEVGDDVLHPERGAGFRCAVSLGDKKFPIPSGAAVLVRRDGSTAGGPLPRDAAAWYLAR